MSIYPDPVVVALHPVPGVSRLPLTEPVRFDLAVLEALCAGLSDDTAEEVVAHTLRDLVRRLSRLEIAVANSRFDSVPDDLDALAGSAARIGLTGLIAIVADIAHCVAVSQPAALAATMARLRRATDRATAEIWSLRGAGR